MRPYLILLILIYLKLPVFAQTAKKDCDCPKNNFITEKKANKVFTFKNGNTIGLCGYLETGGNETIYSEFVLFQCGQQKALGEWEANKECKIQFRNDTLYVKNLFNIPVGQNFKYIYRPFRIQTYYYKNSTLVEATTFNKDLPKYSLQQVKDVLNRYVKLNKNQYDRLNVVADQLFWAYVSGSSEAGKYLDTFEKKFGPLDGHNAEEFEELWDVYQTYKLKK